MDAAEEIVAGIGVSSAATAAAVLRLLQQGLDSIGLSVDALTRIASISSRSDSDVLAEVASVLNLPITWHSAEDLRAVNVPTPSEFVAERTGSSSVAEAAALLGVDPYLVDGDERCAELLVAKLSDGAVTVALARHWRPDLGHHGDAEASAGLLDLAVNVSTEPHPRWLTSAIGGAMVELQRYPDTAAATSAVARCHGRQPSEVLVTAGAAEAFSLMAQAFHRSGARDRAVVVHPQFTEPEVALRSAGWNVARLVLSTANGFAFDPGQVDPEATLVVIGNPTNPTGTLHSRQSLRALIRPGRIVVVDEAFMDTVPGEPQSLATAADAPDLTGLMVVRSLTKMWGLAGLRVGYVLAAADTIARLASVQPRWSVSTPALAAAQACVSEEAIVEAGKRARRVVADRDRLMELLAVRGLDVLADRHGPFVLVSHPQATALHALLRESSVAVRRCDTFPGLGQRWLRIAVRPEAETEKFLLVLDEVLTQLRGPVMAS